MAVSAQAKTYTVKVTGTIGTTPTQTFSTTFSLVVAASMSLTAPGAQYTAQGTAKDITLAGTNTTSTTTWAITSQAVTGISMSTATASADIYYTTDGSEPTTSSTKYTSQITLTSSQTDVTFKARAFKTGLAPSAVVTKAAGYEA